MIVERYAAESALTPTGGFLKGYTHTLNPAIGCPFGQGFCGQFCYARWGMAHQFHGEGRNWGDYLKVKENLAERLEEELATAARRPADHPHAVGNLRIFASSTTEPCAGPVLEIFRRCLRVLAAHPVGRLVIQTRSPRVTQLREEIEALGQRVVLSFSLEADSDEVWSIGPKGAPGVAERRAVFETLSSWRTITHLAVAPCLPLKDSEGFARWISATADFVTVDTFTCGDGSTGGNRTSRTPLPMLLERHGHDWRDETQPRELFARLRRRMGDRARWSQEGFRRLIDPHFPGEPTRTRLRPG
ncbi:MAG: hypothetical protein HY763_10895 [Planctomycetes bacterium]|nr:hypothetical protein [Planctomycetota bacterium]